MKIDQSTVAGGIAGAVVVVLVWLVKALAQLDVPLEVSMALVVIIQGAVTHFCPNSPRSQWTPEQRAKLRGLDAEIEAEKEKTT